MHDRGGPGGGDRLGDAAGGDLAEHRVEAAGGLDADSGQLAVMPGPDSGHDRSAGKAGRGQDPALAKALGLVTYESPDPENLTRELEAERKARQDDLTFRQALILSKTLWCVPRSAAAIMKGSGGR